MKMMFNVQKKEVTKVKRIRVGDKSEGIKLCKWRKYRDWG